MSTAVKALGICAAALALAAAVVLLVGRGDEAPARPAQPTWGAEADASTDASDAGDAAPAGTEGEAQVAPAPDAAARALSAASAEAEPVVLASGRVMDDTGAPVAGARLELRAVGDAGPWTTITRSDAAGRFELRGPPREGPLRLDVEAPEHLQRTLPVDAPREGLAVALQRYAVLSGAIAPPHVGRQYELRLGPRGARDLPRTKWGALPHATPETESGRFVFRPVPPGTYELLVARRGQGLENVVHELLLTLPPGPARPLEVDPLDLSFLVPPSPPEATRSRDG